MNPLKHLMVVAWLALSVVSSQAAEPATSYLEPLQTPTMDNAFQVATSLDRLAATQEGKSKRLTERTVQVSKAIQATNKQAAKHWLTPNSLGLSSPNHYHNAEKKAQNMRAAAAERLKFACADLAYTVKQTELALEILTAEGHAEVCPRIKASMQAIASRALDIPEPGKLSREEFGKQLLAIALVAAVLASTGSSNNAAPADLDAAWQQQHQWDRIREIRASENRTAEIRGKPLPYPGAQ